MSSSGFIWGNSSNKSRMSCTPAPARSVSPSGWYERSTGWPVITLPVRMGTRALRMWCEWPGNVCVASIAACSRVSTVAVPASRACSRRRARLLFCRRCSARPPTQETAPGPPARGCACGHRGSRTSGRKTFMSRSPPWFASATACEPKGVASRGPRRSPPGSMSSCRAHASSTTRSERHVVATASNDGADRHAKSTSSPCNGVRASGAVRGFHCLCSGRWSEPGPPLCFLGLPPPRCFAGAQTRRGARWSELRGPPPMRRTASAAVGGRSRGATVGVLCGQACAAGAGSAAAAATRRRHAAVRDLQAWVWLRALGVVYALRTVARLWTVSTAAQAVLEVTAGRTRARCEHVLHGRAPERADVAGVRSKRCESVCRDRVRLPSLRSSHEQLAARVELTITR